MSEIKYRHPVMAELEWSGRGRQPKWVESYLAAGGTMASLEVAAQDRDDIENMENMLDAAETASSEIDLGIGASAPVNPLAVHEGLSDIASKQPEASQQQLEVCLAEFGFQALTMDEFIQVGIEELNQATIRACRAGVAFWAAQEAFKNNESAERSRSLGAECAERTPDFKGWIEAAGLTKERVYECIRIAKFYARLPDTMRSKALSLGKKSALLLASLPQEVIDQAAESGNDLIEKADMMTVADLKEEIKRLERINKNLDADIEIKDGQIKRLSQAKARTTDFLLRTEELREESMAIQFGAELHLNSLRKLFEEIDPEVQEARLQQETLWVCANVILARALDLVAHLQAIGPDGLPDRPQTQHMLTPEEAIRWLQDYPLIENRFAAEQAMRQDRLDAAKPKGPGRPKGSTNKAAEG